MLNETGEEERLIESIHETYEKKLEAYAKQQKKSVEVLSEKEKDDLKGALYVYSWDSSSYYYNGSWNTDWVKMAIRPVKE